MAIKAITANPAKVLHLNTKGHIGEGYDADLCLLTPELTIDTVIARGEYMVKNGEIVKRGQFENAMLK